MTWVKGIVKGEVTSDGHIIAQTEGLEVMDSPKPCNPQEARDAGMLLNLARALSTREPGPFGFTAHFGGATAMLVPWESLSPLDDDSMAQLGEKYFRRGDYPPRWVAIMHVRNFGAPSVQGAAEPSGGMASTIDLTRERITEMVEMCALDERRRWMHMILPRDLEQYQPRLDSESIAVWEQVGASDGSDRPAEWFPARLRFLPMGRDTLDGVPGIITVGPVGDVALTVIAELDIHGSVCRFVDGETHDGKLIRRHMVAIVPRRGRSPVVLPLDADGRLDERGLPFVLDGENRTLALTHIGASVLEALGWFPEEGTP